MGRREKGFTDYVPLERVNRLVAQHVKVAVRREFVSVDQARGRMLWDDVVSAVDLPPADTSHVDGFAVRALDLSLATEERPVHLRRTKGVPVGKTPRTSVRPGEAQPVLTGGLIPSGADAVVQVEKVVEEDNQILASHPVEAGAFVYGRGRDVQKGEKLLAKGTQLAGPDLSLLASLRFDRVPVYGKPRVSILPTGSELTSRIRSPPKGKVVETHSLFLAALVEGAGGLAVKQDIVPDELGALTRSIKYALRTSDIVLTIAGSSLGEPDLTEASINAAGEPGVLAHGVKLHRGRVMGLGVVDGKAIVILPGPIQGATNAFGAIAYPIIRAHLGREFESPPWLPAKVKTAWDAGDRYRDFSKVVYVKARIENGEIWVEPCGGETEKMTLLARSQGYLLLDEGTVRLSRGDLVRMSLLPGLSFFPFVGG